MPLAISQIINDRYRIARLLGQGGFGAVYRAWDMRLLRFCAIKENRETSEASARQFQHEAHILAGLSHPHLPHVFDAFTITGQNEETSYAYLVMEYIEGEDLGQVLQRQGGSLAEDRVLPIIIQVCEALEYLHNQKPPIIHRDIKPANIKIAPSEKMVPGVVSFSAQDVAELVHVTAILVDFGIAKLYHPDVRTTVGARAVTPGYSPPEQYGRGATDARSDIYALGATLYHLLTGILPPDSVDVMTRTAPPPVPACLLNPAISPGVSAAIERAMQLEREQRWSNVAEFRQVLAECVQRQQDAPQQRKTEKLSDNLPPVEPTESSDLPAPVGESHARTGEQSNRFRLFQARKTPLSWSWLGSMAVLGMVLLLGIVGLFLVAQELLPSGNPDPAGLGITPPTPTQLAIVRPTRTATASPDPSPTPAPLQSPTSLPASLTDGRGGKMVLIPAGPFLMGGDPDLGVAECEGFRITGTCERSMFEDEQPLHTVTLADFYIDLTEVTNAMYDLCVKTGVCTLPSKLTSYSRASYYGDPEYDHYPVIHVTWDQAVTYCQWRGGRLPTEAEWEKAARGSDGRRFPWGNQFEDIRGNFCDRNCALAWANPEFDDGYEDTSPVGAYPLGASPYGLLDMAGNVWEWVADWYLDTYYQVSPMNNPLGPAYGVERVLRGGGWSYSAYYLHASFRGRNSPANAATYAGLRCVRDP
ncbi:MAG: SUMF1/EgtB/PvdO family nonheme iron enzyme [Anaerolineales bacterium]|nr:SUMF1/EgtB/PvdO family nonheme iron enzyme [Anaerolineales bacterium]